MKNLPTWALDFPHEIIIAMAEKYHLKVQWVYAIIMKESSGMSYASRFEDKTYATHLIKDSQGRQNYFVRPKDFCRKIGFGYSEATERVHQMTSWGLMQVMGFKAREMGFSDHLPKICMPEIGIGLGCRAFNGFLETYQGVYRHAALAYNAGSVRSDARTGKFVNQSYLDQVLQYIEDLGHTD